MFRNIILTVTCLASATLTHAGATRVDNSVIITKDNANVVITNNKVYVDGKDVTPKGKQITVQVTGNVENLKCDSCSSVTVSGNAGSVRSSSGDVEVTGNVTGDAETTSGDIYVKGGVKGSVSAVSGDIRH